MPEWRPRKLHPEFRPSQKRRKQIRYGIESKLMKDMATGHSVAEIGHQLGFTKDQVSRFLTHSPHPETRQEFGGLVLGAVIKGWHTKERYDKVLPRFGLTVEQARELVTEPGLAAAMRIKHGKSHAPAVTRFLTGKFAKTYERNLVEGRKKYEEVGARLWALQQTAQEITQLTHGFLRPVEVLRMELHLRVRPPEYWPTPR